MNSKSVNKKTCTILNAMDKAKITVPTKSQFIDEIKQHQIIKSALINKILYSKRLLIDHVQSLEQCLQRLGQEQQSYDSHKQLDDIDSKQLSNNNYKNSEGLEICTFKNLSILIGSTLLDCIITPRALRLTLFVPAVVITTTFGTLYSIKKLFGCRNRIMESILANLIRTIDDFGNCIRRNITYFNEIIIMKQQELIESRQCERAWDCITAAKEVTEILFDATRKLECQYPLPASFSQYYSPMEDLKECDYFRNNVTDYCPSHIKDFHNIFAYVQSQFLLRLALTLFVKPSLSRLSKDLVEIDDLIKQLVLEEENHFKNLAIDINKKPTLEMDKLNERRNVRSRNDPVSVLQNTSLKLSACIVAVASECHALDITLQRLDSGDGNFQRKDNAKQLVAVANNMRNIENALSNCFNDFQHLLLVYNKFLNSQLIEKNRNETPTLESSYPSKEDLNESVLRVEISQYPDADNKKDDFYAYLYDGNQQQDQQKLEKTKSDYESEVLNFEKRVTRRKFRPVLKQLKERIDPIKEAMLEKEREVLTAKGINVDKLLQVDASLDDHYNNKCNGINDNVYKPEINNEDLGDSDGSLDKELDKNPKKLHRPRKDRFEESRNFLIEKSQTINLCNFNLPKPSNIIGSEDVLESAEYE